MGRDRGGGQGPTPRLLTLAAWRSLASLDEAHATGYQIKGLQGQAETQVTAAGP